LAAQDNRPAPDVETTATIDEQKPAELTCPACGGRMIVIETLEPGAEPAAHHQRGPPEPQDVPS
jgi:hypothetical protein